MTSPRVLLTTLSVRASARGRPHLSGWLGKAAVVAFAGQPDKHGNPTWDMFLAEPEPREGSPRLPAKPPERDPGRDRPMGALERWRVSGGSQHPSRQGGP